METIRDLLVFFTTMSVFLMNMEFRYPFKRVIKIFVFYGVFSFILYCFLLKNSYDKEIASLICFTFPSLILCFLVSKYRKSKFIFTFAIVDLICILIIIIAKFLSIPFDNSSLVTLIAVIIMLIIYLRVSFKFKRKYLQILNSVSSGWATIALAAVMLYIFTFMMIGYPEPITTREEYYPILLLYVLLVLIFLKVIYDNAKNNIKVYIEEYEHENRNMKIKLNQAYYDLAFKDELSNLKNRNAFEEYLKELENKNEEIVTCISIDIDNLKQINDQIGHYAGDILIKNMGALLKQTFESKNIFRVGGDEFLVIIENSNYQIIETYLNKMEIMTVDIKSKIDIPFKYSKGISSGKNFDIRNILIKADKKMYLEKSNHKSLE